jgi:hypothetical protein
MKVFNINDPDFKVFIPEHTFIHAECYCPHCNRACKEGLLFVSYKEQTLCYKKMFKCVKCRRSFALPALFNSTDEIIKLFNEVEKGKVDIRYLNKDLVNIRYRISNLQVN